MGCFTWTLANKTPVKNKDGYYSRGCVLRYGRYGAILKPDGGLIPTEEYEGYGIFQGNDVYDLAAVWNQKAIPDLLKSKEFLKTDPDLMDKDIQELLLAYAKGGEAEFLSVREYKKATGTFPNTGWLKSEKDWRRDIGILLACDDANTMVPYPIKIVDWHRDRTAEDYKRLPPSISTQ